MPSRITVSVVEKVGVIDGERMWRRARQSQVQLEIASHSFTLITPGLISNKISSSGGSGKAKARELCNKCVCA